MDITWFAPVKVAKRDSENQDNVMKPIKIGRFIRNTTIFNGAIEQRKAMNISRNSEHRVAPTDCNETRAIVNEVVNQLGRMLVPVIFLYGDNNTKNVDIYIFIVSIYRSFQILRLRMIT